MKKKINLMPIVFVILLLFSVDYIENNRATASEKAPLPDSQQPPPLKTWQKPKPEFWDLELERVVVKSKSYYKGQQADVQVTVGETVLFKCYYKMKTIPIGDITKADAQYWGSGNHNFKIATGIGFLEAVKTDTKKLPAFTYANVENWRTYMKNGSPKVWHGYVTNQWKPEAKHVGKKGLTVLCTVDNKSNIKETDEDNNSVLKIGPYVTFVVKYKIIAPGINKKKLETKPLRRKVR